MAKDTGLWLRRCFAEQSGNAGFAQREALDAPQARAEGRGRSPSNPARDAKSTEAPSSSRFGVETGRKDWAAPEPVTGSPCPGNSEARVPACLVGSHGFKSRSGRQLLQSVNMLR